MYANGPESNLTYERRTNPVNVSLSTRGRGLSCLWRATPVWSQAESIGLEGVLLFDSESGCNREYTTGWIPLSVVDNRDEVYDRAEEMTP